MYLLKKETKNHTHDTKTTNNRARQQHFPKERLAQLKGIYAQPLCPFQAFLLPPLEYKAAAVQIALLLHET